MRIQSRNLLMILSALAFAGINTGFAGELDHEGSVTNVEQRAAELPATVVVRVKADDQSVAVMHSSAELPAQQGVVSDASFVPMNADGSMSGAAKSELDKDSSTNSWYFYFNTYSYYRPTYYYYGYNYYYRPYYSYYYGGYNYYYYGYSYYGRRW